MELSWLLAPRSGIICSAQRHDSAPGDVWHCWRRCLKQGWEGKTQRVSLSACDSHRKLRLPCVSSGLSACRSCSDALLLGNHSSWGKQTEDPTGAASSYLEGSWVVLEGAEGKWQGLYKGAVGGIGVTCLWRAARGCLYAQGAGWELRALWFMGRQGFSVGLGVSQYMQVSQWV